MHDRWAPQGDGRPALLQPRPPELSQADLERIERNRQEALRRRAAAQQQQQQQPQQHRTAAQHQPSLQPGPSQQLPRQPWQQQQQSTATPSWPASYQPTPGHATVTAAGAPAAQASPFSFTRELFAKQGDGGSGGSAGGGGASTGGGGWAQFTREPSPEVSSGWRGGATAHAPRQPPAALLQPAALRQRPHLFSGGPAGASPLQQQQQSWGTPQPTLGWQPQQQPQQQQQQQQQGPLAAYAPSPAASPWSAGVLVPATAWGGTPGRALQPGFVFTMPRGTGTGAPTSASKPAISLPTQPPRQPPLQQQQQPSRARSAALPGQARQRAAASSPYGAGATFTFTPATAAAKQPQPQPQLAQATLQQTMRRFHAAKSSAAAAAAPAPAPDEEEGGDPLPPVPAQPLFSSAEEEEEEEEQRQEDGEQQARRRRAQLALAAAGAPGPARLQLGARQAPEPSESFSRPQLAAPRSPAGAEEADRGGGPRQERWPFLKDRRDAEGRRSSDPGYDPSTLLVPPAALARLKGFARQYWTIKKDYHDVVLFVRVGSFYELYDRDADVGLRAGLQPMGSAKSQQANMWKLGCSAPAFEKWAARVLALGYSVGRVEEVPGQKTGEGLVRRQLAQVYSPGTLPPGVMQDSAGGGGPFLALYEGGNGLFGGALVDVSAATLSFAAWQEADEGRSMLGTLLALAEPAEVVCTYGQLTPDTVRLLRGHASRGGEPGGGAG